MAQTPSGAGPKPDAFARICPSRAVLARVGEKWSMLALAALEGGPVRFGDLRRRLEGVSQKVLSQTLRGLERDGLLVRDVYDERLPRVEYRLAERGRTLLPWVAGLKAWAEENLKDIERANAAFDRGAPAPGRRSSGRDEGGGASAADERLVRPSPGRSLEKSGRLPLEPSNWGRISPSPRSEALDFMNTFESLAAPAPASAGAEKCFVP